MSKGSIPRRVNKRKYDTNYDGIKWRSSEMNKIHPKTKKNKPGIRKISKVEKIWLERLKQQVGQIKTMDEFLKTIVIKDIK